MHRSAAVLALAIAPVALAQTVPPPDGSRPAQPPPRDPGSADAPVCYPDCNGDHALNVNDFICSQSAIGLCEATGDCNHDNACNVNDFICFMQAFAAGCSAL